jgi:hypothetical protein
LSLSSLMRSARDNTGISLVTARSAIRRGSSPRS